MADIETLGILDEIQALVSDKLQVVSYKWLSRNFLVPSNTAKRLLQEFVEKNGSQLEVVYSLSGWLKNNPSAYHIKLVLGSKLSEAQEEFSDRCSIQVYSVQACIPKDPAVLWNTEYIQAEELFKEPPNVVNCLRDNRFCGVSNSYVKRNGEGPPVSSAALPLKNVGVCGPSRTSSSKQTSDNLLRQERRVEQSDPKPDQGKDIQSGSHQAQALKQDGKPVAHKEQVPQLPPNKKRNQNDKSSSGTAGSLASIWGRASSKPKPDSASIKTENAIPISNDAQVRANESVEDGSSDDDDGQMNFKRVSNGEGNNRKRRVVFDFSDEDDDGKDTVNLASPDPPKKQVSLDSKKSTKTPSLENKNLDFDEPKEENVKVEKEKVAKVVPKSTLKEESSERKRGPASNENQCPDKDDMNQKDKTSDAAQNVLKKRKVLKTRIDERGREVTEVVWEDDEKETKPDDNTRKDTGDSNTANNVVNRPPAAAPKKSPALGNASSHATGKAGNKKAGTKDPKQGNIMSFFKKV
ncbi:DNA polymerase delta subunit 3 [Cynara cardunculus var. scolymus]|uniref:DNA polymerase delta subunit 3 n=1 Tax=Cynara cardunculus var. scolymus TaxID=59895 RepID=UPI000D6263C8|nr:DNA polymerase delta subunit 3 [Cynara cardunculus var. scolymus]